MIDVRHKCTAEDSWTPEKSSISFHPDAIEIGEQMDNWPAGDLVSCECPHCKTTWKEELPQ